MKRKTAIKKLMGIGLSRNEAADVLFLYHEYGLSNRDIVSREGRFKPWNKLAQIVSSATSTFDDFYNAFSELLQHFNP